MNAVFSAKHGTLHDNYCIYDIISKCYRHN